MSLLVGLILAATHSIAFVAGQVVPWHYGDFASTTREGADTARRLRRKVSEIRVWLYHILRAAEKTTEETVHLYRTFISADRALEALEFNAEDLFNLRDERLHDEIEAFYAAVHGRVVGGHMDTIPALNKGGDLSNPESAGTKTLSDLKYAVGHLDIPACDRLLKRLDAISSWYGFARHRVLRSTERNR